MSYEKLRSTLAVVLGTAYKTQEDELNAILPETEEDFDESKFKDGFLQLDKDRITTIKAKGSEKFDQGYNKAKSEVLTAFEKELKEQFSIDEDDLQGIELVSKIVSVAEEKAGKKPSKLTLEEIKKLPEVIQLLTERENAFKTEKKELEDGYNQKIAEFGKKETFNRVSKKALSIMDGLNLVLSEDPTKASNQKNVILNALKDFDYQDNEAKDDFIVLKDGKRHEDEHGHGVVFESLVKNLSLNYYDQRQADDRSTPPGQDDKGHKGKFSVKNLPKTEAEYAKFMTDTSIPIEDRMAVKEAYQAPSS